ncbi:MAG: aminopeptidase, partial [Candidatus Saccharibacteria bacterium]|nr:aminopeptidase [Pseudorhodobacter sp.]
WLPAERLSVDLAFNHESDSYGAAMEVVAAALGESTAHATSNGAQAKQFVGIWLDAGTGLLLDIAANPDGTVSASYDGGTEVLSIGSDGIARGLDMTLTAVDGGLGIHRPFDGIQSHATPIRAQVGTETSTDTAGTYRSDEVGSELEIICAGGCWFAGFRGFLGTGPMMPLSPVGPDLWRMSCLRSLDAPAPGDWTVQIARLASGAISGVTIGCWLARNVAFRRA